MSFDGVLVGVGGKLSGLHLDPLGVGRRSGAIAHGCCVSTWTLAFTDTSSRFESFAYSWESLYFFTTLIMV